MRKRKGHKNLRAWRIRLAALIDALFGRVIINEEGLAYSSFCKRRNSWLTVYTAETIQELQKSVSSLIQKAKILDLSIHESQILPDNDYGTVARRGKFSSSLKKELIQVLQEINDKILITNEELISYRAILESQVVEYLTCLSPKRRFRKTRIEVFGSVESILGINIDNPAYVEFELHNKDIFNLIKKHEIKEKDKKEEKIS